mgnify:CR=1 FL=1
MKLCPTSSTCTGMLLVNNSILYRRIWVWGHQQFTCIDNVYNRVCRYILGVGKYTPNDFIHGDTGISPPHISQWRAIGRQMCRMSNRGDDRINKRIYDWTLNHANGNCKNSIFKVCKVFDSL